MIEILGVTQNRRVVIHWSGLAGQIIEAETCSCGEMPDESDALVLLDSGEYILAHPECLQVIK